MSQLHKAEKGKISNGVKIDSEKCKACRLCIDVCPQKILVQSTKNNSLGVYVVEQRKDRDCTACMRCAIICPEAAIEVYRR